ncbi:MAG: hypothetical protein LBG58_14910 [Planctomycetaceae bacterium]|nr:hypothetical protein [Planctomycetaceae bacterium]
MITKKMPITESMDFVTSCNAIKNSYPIYFTLFAKGIVHDKKREPSKSG